MLRLPIVNTFLLANTDNITDPITKVFDKSSNHYTMNCHERFNYVILKYSMLFSKIEAKKTIIILFLYCYECI